MSVIKVAAIQALAQEFATDHDFDTQILTLCRRAKEAGAELLVFPEDVGVWLEFKKQGLRFAAFQMAEPLISFVNLLGHGRDLPDGPTAPTLPGQAEELLQNVMNAILKHVKLERFGEWLSQSDIRDSYLQAFTAAARDVELPIVGGSIYEHRPDGIRNVCYVFDRDGSIAGTHDKHNLVEFEKAIGVVPGTTIAPVRTKDYCLGACICYDLNDPHLTSELARQGAQLLCAGSTGIRPWPDYPYIPAVDAPQIERARETGLAVIRAYQCGWVLPGVYMDGLTDIAMPDGTIYPPTPEHRSRERILVAEVPLKGTG